MDAKNDIDGGEGGATLMLPGLMCDTSMFAALADRVPGMVPAADYGDCDTLPAMAERVLDAAPPQFGLFGHSMGARVALEVYRLAPERVTRLALVSTGIHGVRPGEADGRYVLRDIGRDRGMAALVDAWLPPMVAPAARADTDLMAALRTMCIAAGLDRYEAQVNALLTRPDVTALLPAIACPTLVACGDADVWSPPEQHRDIAAAIPDARLVILPGAGHMMPAEAPDAFAAILANWISVTTNTLSYH